MKLLRESINSYELLPFVASGGGSMITSETLGCEFDKIAKDVITMICDNTHLIKPVGSNICQLADSEAHVTSGESFLLKTHHRYALFINTIPLAQIRHRRHHPGILSINSEETPNEERPRKCYLLSKGKFLCFLFRTSNAKIIPANNPLFPEPHSCVFVPILIKALRKRCGMMIITQSDH